MIKKAEKEPIGSDAETILSEVKSDNGLSQYECNCYDSDFRAKINESRKQARGRKGTSVYKIEDLLETELTISHSFKATPPISPMPFLSSLLLIL